MLWFLIFFCQTSVPGVPPEQPQWNHFFLFTNPRDKATLFTPGAALVIEFYQTSAGVKTTSFTAFVLLPKEILITSDWIFCTAVLIIMESALYKLLIRVPMLPGKPGKPGILSFTFPGLENAWNLLTNCGKTGIGTQYLEKNLYFVNFVFQDSLSRCHFQKKSDLRLCHICIINTNTDSKPNWSGISLHLPGNNLENI